VLRYDTRGAGLSQKIRPPLAIDSMVDDLVALLDALDITGKVALAGIAVGGAIALHTAALCPQRVAAAVVSSPAISIPSDRRPALLARVEKMEREGLRAVIDTLDLGYPPELRDNAQRFAAFRARWLGGDPISYGAIYRMLAGMDLAPELPRIACPILVIAGTLDRTRPPLWSSRWHVRFPARATSYSRRDTMRRYRRPNYTSERSMSFSTRFVRSPTAWSACQGSLWLETRERHRCRAPAQLRNFSPDARSTRRAVDTPLRSKGTARTCPGDNTTVRHHWC
jgi:hypothetical protein